MSCLRPAIARVLDTTHLCYPPNVLIPILLGEPEVFVESEAHIVAVETVRREAKMQKVLLEGGRNGRFS